MNCAGCDRLLEKREHAQPMTFQDRRYWPSSLCDVCARDNMWPGGSADALTRLLTGAIDPAEAARVLAATSGWDNPHESSPIDRS